MFSSQSKKKFSLLFSRRTLSSLAVSYDKNGSPESVLKLTTSQPLPVIRPTEVKLRFIAAPINPSDFNMIEGVYGVKATLPAVGGNEGVAKIIQVGSEVKNLVEGDWVIPISQGFGTWRQDAIASANQVVKVPNYIDMAYAATLSVNPCTSYRLLRDVVSLKQGDVIIQNAANSMVGVGIIQMAREMGIKTVNIIRQNRSLFIVLLAIHMNPRPHAENELRLLTNLGGDINIFDTMVNTPLFKDIMADLPPCTYGINAVGGDSAVEIARALAPNGTMVTYGGMSKQAPVIPLDVIIEKNLKLRGFWMKHWYDTHSVSERIAMYEDIAKLIVDSKLSYFLELHDLDDFSYALKRAKTSYMFRKVVLNCDYPDRLAEHDKLTDDDYEMFKYPSVDE